MCAGMLVRRRRAGKRSYPGMGASHSDRQAVRPPPPEFAETTPGRLPNVAVVAAEKLWPKERGMRRITVLTVMVSLFVASVALAEERNMPAERFNARAATISAIFAAGQPNSPALRPGSVRPAGSTCDLAPSGECWGGDQNEGDPTGWGGGSVPSECNTVVRDLASCLSKCRCIYNYNLKKCPNPGGCRDLVESEKNACDAQCEIDFI